ncbi:hypothetical protein TNCV_1595591 [Trichonephila clavipes]|nr:hypothetical protein TNCV_1595591 [Trichonephila clavipes]
MSQLSEDLTCITAQHGVSLVVRTLGKPAMIRYLDHWATTAFYTTPNFFVQQKIEVDDTAGHGCKNSSVPQFFLMWKTKRGKQRFAA